MKSIFPVQMMIDTMVASVCVLVCVRFLCVCGVKWCISLVRSIVFH